MWHSRCIATWGRPTPSQCLFAVTVTPVPSLKSVNLALPVLLRFTADTLLYFVALTFDHAILTFDLWPWTLLVYRLWRNETLYQIWAKSNNPRRSYCDLNIWVYDLEHVSRVPLCSGIILTKFKLRQLISLRNERYLTPSNAVTLTFDHLTLNICST